MAARGYLRSLTSEQDKAIAAILLYRTALIRLVYSPGSSGPLPRRPPGSGSAEWRPLIAGLRSQRLGSLDTALGATADGLPAARRLVVLPSKGISEEVLLAPGDPRTVSYAPLGSVFRYLRGLARPDRHASLLALGDPI